MVKCQSLIETSMVDHTFPFSEVFSCEVIDYTKTGFLLVVSHPLHVWMVQLHLHHDHTNQFYSTSNGLQVTS